MFNNFQTPMSPKGLSASNPTPPWHYAANLLSIEYWTDPEMVKAYLPSGLTLDPANSGRASAIFVDYQFSGSNDEYLAPERYLYHEYIILVDALYDGKPATFCPYIFIDNDASLMRGVAQGWPKRFGHIAQTLSFPGDNPAAAPLQPGVRHAGSASVAGQRIAYGEIVLKEVITDPSDISIVGRTLYLRRHFADLQAGQHEKPLIHQLVKSVTTDTRLLGPVWAGEGKLVMPKIVGEEISDLAPTRVGSAYKFSITSTVADLQVVTDYNKL